jgi:xylono-1,5-lactonase
MRSLEWELLVEGFGRLEAPRQDSQGRVCFADMRPPGKVLRLESDGSVTTLADREHVGGLALHIDGGIVASGPTVSVLNENGGERVLLEPGSGWGFNDMATDPAGNLFVGKFGERPTAPTSAAGTGSLWRISSDGPATQCYDGIQLTNGLGVAPDGSRLYHNDTGARLVWVSELDAGLPVKRRVLYEFPAENPDGLAIDEAGCLWVAAIGSGTLIRLTPDGRVDQAYEGPQNWTSSVCFGGDDRRDLYAVTFGGEPYDADRSGGLYRARVDVGGGVVHPARV